MGRTRMPSKPCKEIRMKLSAIAAATLTAVAAVPASAEISDGKVKIGILNDQSGVYADFGGKWSFEAAKMAAEDFGGKVQTEEHTSELQSLMRISYAGFCLKKKKS